MIKKLTIKNFKAIDSAAISFQSLNCLIGNNGVGKSSVIEALQTLKDILVFKSTTKAMEHWGGLERIRNYRSKRKTTGKTLLGVNIEYEPVAIKFTCEINKVSYEYEIQLNTSENENYYLIQFEKLKVGKKKIVFEANIDPSYQRKFIKGNYTDWIDGNRESFLTYDRNTKEVIALREYILSWQFLSLNSHIMGTPITKNREAITHTLDSDGSNISEILKESLDNEKNNYESIIRKLKYVLPYVSDLKTNETNELIRKIFLEMKEVSSNHPIPGWLLSSGTLRVLGFLSILNRKNPPPVLFIEEIENGLDPRTLNLLVEEMIGLMPKHQFIITTHSPYFLDLIDLQHVIVAERQDNSVLFFRPDDDVKLDAWKEKFSTGKLYTMNKLNRD